MTLLEGMTPENRIYLSSPKTGHVETNILPPIYLSLNCEAVKRNDSGGEDLLELTENRTRMAVDSLGTKCKCLPHNWTEFITETSN